MEKMYFLTFQKLDINSNYFKLFHYVLNLKLDIYINYNIHVSQGSELSELGKYKPRMHKSKDMGIEFAYIFCDVLEPHRN